MNEYVFSPSSLEAYLLCPYRFYAQYLLKLKPEVQWEVEMTPLETGQILHRILEIFLRERQGKRSQNASEEQHDLEKRIMTLMEEHMEAFQKGRPNLSPVLLEHRKKKITRTLLSFLE